MSLRHALAASLLLLLAGCASETAEDDAKPVRFVVIAAPEIGGDAEPPNEDILYEVITDLSTDASIDFCLVPGPLLGEPEPEGHELLLGALGQIAGRVYPALGPDDGPRAELLEALGDESEGLKGHDGEAAFWGRIVRGVRPLVLGPDGGTPEKAREDDEDAPPLTIAVYALGTLPGGDYALEVTTGEEASLTSTGATVKIVLPRLGIPPHVYGLVEIAGRKVSLSLRSAAEGTSPPPDPEPITLGAR